MFNGMALPEGVVAQMISASQLLQVATSRPPKQFLDLAPLIRIEQPRRDPLARAVEDLQPHQLGLGRLAREHLGFDDDHAQLAPLAAERFDDFALAARFEGYAEEAEQETKAPPHAKRRREGGKARRHRKSKARQ
jgi:hypothetical protein